MIRNLVITGVGGQGVVTAAALVRWAALDCGYLVRGLDNRGGAQRLGHVSAVIRCCRDPERPLSPEIPHGECDLLLSLEAGEGLRFLPVLAPTSTVVHATRLVVPTNQRRKRLDYLTLDQCRAGYRACAARVCEIDLDGEAMRRFKKPVLANLIALGAGLHLAEWRDFIAALVPTLADESRAAFEAGIELARVRAVREE